MRSMLARGQPSSSASHLPNAADGHEVQHETG
jgi:hypothetical protein